MAPIAGVTAIAELGKAPNIGMLTMTMIPTTTANTISAPGAQSGRNRKSCPRICSIS